MNILLTGAVGFIGSHLIPALSGLGWSIAAFDKTGGMDRASDIRSFRGDVVSGEGLDAAVSGMEVVVHLAARNHLLRYSVKDPLAEYRRINVEGTRNVFRAAFRAGAGLFIHMSSVKAMGERSDEILDEWSPCVPATPYGISKRESEEAIEVLAQGSGMHVVILRLPMVYGPHSRGNVTRLIRWADLGLPCPLVMPENLRSVVYVENVTAAVLAVLGKSLPGVSTYIVKDPEDCSMRMLYSTICQNMGKSPRFFLVKDWMVRFGTVLSHDWRKVTDSFRVSSVKIEREIGFTPLFTLEEGLARTVRWYQHPQSFR